MGGGIKLGQEPKRKITVALEGALCSWQMLTFYMDCGKINKKSFMRN